MPKKLSSPAELIEKLDKTVDRLARRFGHAGSKDTKAVSADDYFELGRIVKDMLLIQQEQDKRLAKLEDKPAPTRDFPTP